MAAATSKKAAATGRRAPGSKRAAKTGAREAQRAAALARANLRLDEIAGLKADAAAGRLGAEALLADPRARGVNVLTILAMLPRTSLEAAFDVLLACQINGARRCEDLTTVERRALGGAIAGDRTQSRSPATAERGRPPDRELDRALSAARVRVPVVELAPSEFAAARAGLEADPLLLRMVDRLVDAVRLYAERDDGGVRARVVAEQWIRFRNYNAKVASGEYPPPTLRAPALLE